MRCRRSVISFNAEIATHVSQLPKVTAALGQSLPVYSGTQYHVVDDQSLQRSEVSTEAGRSWAEDRWASF